MKKRLNKQQEYLIKKYDGVLTSMANNSFRKSKRTQLNILLSTYRAIKEDYGIVHMDFVQFPPKGIPEDFNWNELGKDYETCIEYMD